MPEPAIFQTQHLALSDTAKKARVGKEEQAQIRVGGRRSHGPVAPGEEDNTAQFDARKSWDQGSLHPISSAISPTSP